MPVNIRDIYVWSNSTTGIEIAHSRANTPAGSSRRIYFHDNRSMTMTSAMMRMVMGVGG